MIGIRIATPIVSPRKPARMILLGLRLPARLPASSATANMLSESGASEIPASSALYSSTICRNIGSTIIRPPSAICCSVCDEIPSRKYFDAKSAASISAGLPSRLRFLSHHASEPSATKPTASSAPTAPPPSSQTRMPSTTPPMPSAERIAPTTSIERSPVYGTSCTRRVPTSTIAMITTSPPKATRQERYVVMKPPTSGPIAAAIAAAAPTSAYARRCIAPSKLPWISDCIDGSRSDAPSPPTTAQKMTIGSRLCDSVIDSAPAA